MTARGIISAKLLTLSAVILLILIASTGCGNDRAAELDTVTATPAPPLAGPQLSGKEMAAAGSSTPSATATPTATTSPTHTPTNTPTATPTPTATATPLPSQRLTEARHLHEIGNYAAARSAYAALLRDQPDGPEAYEARWRLGQAYLEDGEVAEAAVALEIARQEVPAGTLPAEVDFWLGESLAQLGQPARAIEAYRRYLAREDLLAAEVYLRIGPLLRATGDTEAAIEALQQAVSTASDNFVLFAAREVLADTYVELEDWQAALDQYDQILSRSRYDRYRAEIHYRAGQVLEQAGRPAAAATRYRRVLAESEASPYAYHALNALDALEQPVDDVTRGRVLIRTGYVTDGIHTIYRYLEAVPDHPGYLHTLVAEAYFGQRNYQAAVDEWQKLLDTHPEYGDRAGVLMRMAAAHGRMGNIATARSLYAQAAAQSTARAPTALLEAARLSERAHDCQTAATDYLDLAQRYPATAAAGEALYRAGLCQYRLGQVSSAAETWQRVVDDYASNTYAHASRFWAGKARLELDDAATAVALWQGLAPVAADSYYTARAAELASAAGLSLGRDVGQESQETGAAPAPIPDPQAPITDPQSLNVSKLAPQSRPRVSRGRVLEPYLTNIDQSLITEHRSPITGSQEEAEQWLAGWAAPGVEDPASLRTLPAAVADDPQLKRGEAYLRLGLRAEALREFDAVRQRYQDDPLATYALALHYRDLGAYRHATQSAVRLIALSPEGLLDAPLFIQRLAYPTYFSELVEAEAAARDMDPLLIYALIRQESYFERGARSYAAAQGLTQVIPSTAEWIANAIGWPDFELDDIYKPYVNVKFGTYYLYAALEMFDGDTYAALVGYNAGPGNARHWLEQTEHDDPDLFVEEVTLSEPKLYVRRVLAHYANYRRLYGSQ